jgi:hypothetical protein
MAAFVFFGVSSRGHATQLRLGASTKSSSSSSATSRDFAYLDPLPATAAAGSLGDASVVSLLDEASVFAETAHGMVSTGVKEATSSPSFGGDYAYLDRLDPDIGGSGIAPIPLARGGGFPLPGDDGDFSSPVLHDAPKESSWDRTQTRTQTEEAVESAFLSSPEVFTAVPSPVKDATPGAGRLSRRRGDDFVGGGYVYSGGRGRCPAPTPGSTRQSRLALPRKSSPLNTLAALGADVLAVGDSTDKLWVLAGCGDVLPDGERCDPGSARLGIPDVTQIPHNMRPYVFSPSACGRSGAGAPAEFGAERGLASSSRCESAASSAVSPDGCCDTSSSQVISASAEEVDARKCCMSSRESRAAAGCAIAGGGAVGSLHVFGPGPGPYVSVEAEAYDAYGFTRSTPERVVQALGNFTRWARGDKPWATVDERSILGGDGPSLRPTLAVINTNYWAQKFGSGQGETVERFAEEHEAALQDLVEHTRRWFEEDKSKGGAGGCVVLRTQHEMVGNGREEANEKTRALNAAARRVGVVTGAPVFPWAEALANELGVAESVFDGWCHQHGDASLHMWRRFTTWAGAHLPPECFEPKK